MEGSGGSSYYNPPTQGTPVELLDLNIAVEEGFHTQIPDLNIGVEEGQTFMLPSNNSTQIPPENGSNMEEADDISIEESNSNMEEADFDMKDADFDAKEAYFDFVKAGFDMEEANYDIEETDFDMEEAEVQGSSHKSDQFREIPLSRRSTLMSMADALKISKTCHRLLKIRAILRHSSPLKLIFTPENKIVRLRFCLSMLESNDSTFKGIHDTAHIDEKWFYLTRKFANYYLLPDEEEPYRTCKSKSFIPKGIFLAAVARPRFDAAGNVLFFGKIAIFPLVTKEPAKRSSVNRPAGTLETKPITTVNKDVMKTFLIDKVLPAIREKWSRDDMRSPIYIQQDNARPHVKFDDDDFKKAVKQNHFNVILTNQLANSPDLNVLDLGFFFCAIQSLQQQAATPKTIDDLIMAVENSFEEFSPMDSDKNFFIFTKLYEGNYEGERL
ncbi:hypothetical protein CCACVL1_06135 [Corchorus capsularis]|uniref:Transposase n=1 Tax=Corchorus capsularis TaxID=210143 RepID=A0A1R3JH72_COCAP|nr:hypothetical protein CCACVL1_06135 [Corchorus capsularis]